MCTETLDGHKNADRPDAESSIEGKPVDAHDGEWVIAVSGRDQRVYHRGHDAHALAPDCDSTITGIQMRRTHAEDRGLSECQKCFDGATA